MNNALCAMPPEERVRFALRALYERYDYRPYRMSQFEEYSLYAENRSFLQSPRVITFTDLDGRMMALKPDVTLSIVRHAQENPVMTEKLYYTENVFRPSAQSQAFKEISQIGVEAVGRIDVCQTAEVVALAGMSLEAISGDTLLEVSHMRFTVGLLNALGVADAARAQALAALAARNRSALAAAAAQSSLCEADTNALLSLLTLYGGVEGTLQKARLLCRSGEMTAALDELEAVLRAASVCVKTCRIQLDFSVAGDTDYYNGLMLRGYISGLPRAVLLGGRYDNILKKLGKGGGGIGFAIDLSEVSRLPGDAPQEAVDLIVRYEPGCDAAALLAAVSQETARGLRVRALPVDAPAGELQYARSVTLDELTGRKGGGDAC